MQQSFSRSSLVPSGFVVESAYHDGDRAIITVRPSTGFGLCPSCGTVSRRVHSRYRRRVTDLPLSGRIVQLVVIARRFRCDGDLPVLDAPIGHRQPAKTDLPSWLRGLKNSRYTESRKPAAGVQQSDPKLKRRRGNDPPKGYRRSETRSANLSLLMGCEGELKSHPTLNKSTQATDMETSRGNESLRPTWGSAASCVEWSS